MMLAPSWSPLLLVVSQRVVTLAAFTALVAAFQPSILLGQSSDNTFGPGESPVHAHLNTIKLSSRLRVQTATDRMEGRLLFRSPDSLAIRENGVESRLPLAGVDSMWVRKYYTVPGMLIGVAAGAGAYWLITKEEYDGSDTYGLDNLIGAGVWAGSALLGTVIGRLIPGWRQVHP